jgi:hypothetical protein
MDSPCNFPASLFLLLPRHHHQGSGLRHSRDARPEVRLGADRERAEQTGFAVSRQHFPSILNALERGETLVEVV